MLVLLGIFGAALLYGDGMITPAISVLGATEGLNVITPLFEPYVVPLSVVILIALFVMQKFGTHRVGGLFGPVMVLWFLTIALLGVTWIVRAPEVLTAVDPRHAIRFFRAEGTHALPGARRRVPGGHRRRSALRGHGPLRQAADPDRVVLAGAAGAAPQLLRPGRAAAAQHRARSSRSS